MELVGMKRITYFSYSHGARDGTNAVTDGGQEADLHAIDRLVELVNLLLLGRFVVPLVGNRGVSLGFDMGCFEWFRHVDGGCCGKCSTCGDGDGCER